MSKIKGRGNYTWSQARDKKAYNISLDTKVSILGIDCAPTKKWSILAEVADHSLLCNRAGFALAHQMDVGQDTASADVWMNGEYQGCYTVTPKYDSFVTKDGYLIEDDNYKEDSVESGGDPQFSLDGLEGRGNDYNLISVKKMGDNLLMVDGAVDESPANLTAAANKIKEWLQDAWDAIRSTDGYNSKGKYYTEYIDIESFAKMYLMHEYVKSYDICAGSILFHRDGQTDADKLFAGPLWDLDNGMGSTQTNGNLGSVGDRRSGKGAFITEITEYKTSIYKTIGRHADFMEEVKRQYNNNREVFENAPAMLAEMRADIEASAMMNHNKVESIGMGAFNSMDKLNEITILNPDCEIYDAPDTICQSVPLFPETMEKGEDDTPATESKSVFTGTIRGYENSTAQAYAEKYDYQFESLGPAPEPLTGDYNENGKVESDDAQNVLNYYVKTLSGGDPALTDRQKQACDVNADGAVDVTDAQYILLYYVKNTVANNPVTWAQLLEN